MTLREPYKTALQCSPNLRRQKLTELADSALGEGHGSNWVHETPATLDDYYSACAWWVNAYWGADGPTTRGSADPDYIDIFA